MAKVGEMEVTVKPRVMVHVRLVPQDGVGDIFRGEIPLARVPCIGETIEHDTHVGTVKAVTFYTDGSAPYVVAGRC